MRGFHVQRDARERYQVEGSLFGTRGDLVVSDLAAIRRLAARMNAARPVGGTAVAPGEIGALALLHEVGHLLIARYEDTARPRAMRDALGSLETSLGRDAKRLLDRFGEEFPGPGPKPEPPVERLEELLLTRIANENPAIGPLHELVDDRPLARDTRYREAIAELEDTFAAGPPIGPDGSSLIELMRAPARHAPSSLAGQLRYVRSAWAGLLGPALEGLIGQLDQAIGILAEEERALHLRFGGGTGGAGDGPTATPSFSQAADEPEAFSTDSAWMPRVVLLAKSTYVWLDQLSRQYGRDIRTLDAIPDEELDAIASWGVTGLWLIGLWERSSASERIKRMRGNPDAVASAYSLDDYAIAADLGGEEAHARLRDRAWARGVRLASDMVPNHMGIDSRWVIEHPEWFLSLPEPPYPAYTFDGPDLSSDPRAGIVLEDHYWDDSDAAVVFKRFDRGGAGDRYVYHGNDGTSFPWNDTAQLDFIKAEVREQVTRTIVDVARRFPIIRFDAAMVLTKKHIQRLWWPEPGTGGGIPSRAEHAISTAEFDALMPAEFWREVVDRVAAEVPDTLLLAEAFWLLEGFFVRTLGMHRVYNSAFMHMLRDEDGAGYRKVIRETIEFDPEILKRYVNFMSNPDEKTALEQFGKGDKYFGVATMMATLPGLPMLGHGQIQGFSEKYGMEFRRATMDERPDPWLLERHAREIFPLLHRRSWFAEASEFRLYDLVTTDGSVDESVFAYSNGTGSTRSLVVYHARFATTEGRIRVSAEFADKKPDGSKTLKRSSLAAALGLPDEPGVFVRYRDARTGLEYLHATHELHERGLAVRLEAYDYNVFWEFREVRDGVAGLWGRVAAKLVGAGVPSLDDTLREFQLEPVHAPLRAVFADELVSAVLDGTTTEGQLDELEARFRRFLAALGEATGVDGDAATIAAGARARAVSAFAAERDLERSDRAALLVWVALERMGELAPAADVHATSRAWYDELRLPGAVATGLRHAGLDEAEAWSTSELVRVLLSAARPSTIGGPGKTTDARLVDAWLADEAVRVALGVNRWEGVDYLDRDRLATLLAWIERLDAIDPGPPWPKDRALTSRLLAAAETAGYRLDRLVASLTFEATPTPSKARAKKVPERAKRPRRPKEPPAR